VNWIVLEDFGWGIQFSVETVVAGELVVDDECDKLLSVAMYITIHIVNAVEEARGAFREDAGEEYTSLWRVLLDLAQSDADFESQYRSRNVWDVVPTGVDDQLVDVIGVEDADALEGQVVDPTTSKTECFGGRLVDSDVSDDRVTDDCNIEMFLGHRGWCRRVCCNSTAELVE